MSHDREKKCLDDRIIVDTSSRPAVSVVKHRMEGEGKRWSLARGRGHSGVALAQEEPRP